MSTNHHHLVINHQAPRHHLLDGSHSPPNIALYAFGIGIVFGQGLFLIFLSIFSTYHHHWLGTYLIALSTFHLCEYLFTALYNVPKLNLDSFLIPHSNSYVAANLVAIGEVLVYTLYFPQFTALVPWHIRCIGLALVIFGQAIRSAALMHAGTNFSHQIEHVKRPNHQLVTTGIYSVLRHPSYFAFFWWGLGTQMLLGNPISFIGYFISLSMFFRDRIEYEENLLRQFFGDEYSTFQNKVHVWIPFI